MKHSTKALLGYLRSWHLTSTGKQRNKGHYVDLTFCEFLNLFDTKQLQKLRIALMDGKIKEVQNETNEHALVLTWRSYAARSSEEFTSETAFVCTREESFKINRSGTGDTLRPSHVHNMSEGLKGRTLSDEHRANISEACKGVAKPTWSEEKREKFKAVAAKREAAKRAAREAAKGAGA
ncbi:hypothetical protein [Sphingomonas sp. Leaf28]|uniref:hypothetical protein n=1 Tax=Sphingomonas sp. Leaf28 TaxID=1735695 RepID=UPI000701FFDD|nr:hypothetical protein [Sphingomonas sp. Leaf28]KQN09060.1 hypothetical protein ASE79_14505 [Sphingomonas sp. Leaf28]